jgi:hypothetical protein
MAAHLSEPEGKAGPSPVSVVESPKAKMADTLTRPADPVGLGARAPAWSIFLALEAAV